MRAFYPVMDDMDVRAQTGVIHAPKIISDRNRRIDGARHLVVNEITD
jgi:hypothetical protein